MNLLHKNVVVAKVAWRLRDAIYALVLMTTLPLLFDISLVLLNKAHALPSLVSRLFLTDPYWSGASLTLVAVVVEIAVLWWLKRKYQLSLADFGLRGFAVWPALGYIVGFYLITIILASIAFVVLKLLVPAFNVDQAQNVGFEFGRSGWGLVVSFVATVVVAPVIEELYFRGVLTPVLVRRLGWLPGAAISSALFAVLHFQPNIIVFTFLLGIFLSLMYIRLRSIVPGIFLHILNNLIAFALLANWIR